MNTKTPLTGSGDLVSARRARASVVTVRESMVTVAVEDGAVMKNEVGFVCAGSERLKAEILRVQGRTADMQVYADTEGVRVGDRVEMTGEMLSVDLGPGLLGQVLDGLASPLGAIASRYGFFLPRGADIPPLDTKKKWDFQPAVKAGDKVVAGQALGAVPEGPIAHKIMVPFSERETLEVERIEAGSFTVEETVAILRAPSGRRLSLGLRRRWPVRRPVPENLLRRRLVERLYPSEPLATTQRVIDTFFPIARGGTACIPGPFGAGKTVLQSLIARYAAVDIVIIVACGERAGEVVETITEYPATRDPHTGGSLMERTIIICNTSSMPVAARESSIFTGVTIGEYYRQMGCHVVVIADSTSRWAQAMRETSGRMEEIPGEDAFPAYLDSAIKGIYERAGIIRSADGSVGSLTLIGTVSPAGGNFDEPVTQATLATVKTFLGLSSDRAYRRCYPAIDPLISWSRYLDQLEPWYNEKIGPGWVPSVRKLRELLVRGDSVYQMLQVTGEEGISIEDFVVWQKSVFLDMVYLQQDAFDEVDISMPRERQVESFQLVRKVVERDYDFKNNDAVRDFFTKITGLFKNLNYSAPASPERRTYLGEIEALLARP